MDSRQLQKASLTFAASPISLLNRVKFPAITANNLDECVKVCVSISLQHIEHGFCEVSLDCSYSRPATPAVAAAFPLRKERNSLILLLS
jgi:polyphosphate kinase